MSSNYPDSYDYFIEKTDGIDSISASDINNIQDSLSKIEHTLGLNPANSSVVSTATTVAQRLNGIEEMGSIAEIAALTASLNAHLAIAYESHGINTSNQVVINPPAGTAPISTTSDELCTNLNAEKFNGYSWSDLADIMNFHNQPDYDSGWFHIDAGNTYTLTHSVGAEPLLYFVLVSDEQNPANVGDGDYYSVFHTSRVLSGAIYIRNVNSNTLVLGVNSDGWYSPELDALNTSGSCRVLAWKGSPWRGFTPDYDSGWFTITGGNSYIKTHNMDSSPKLFQVLFSEEIDPNNSDSNYYTIVSPFGFPGASDGISIHNINTSQFTVKTMNTWRNYDGTALNSGTLRILAWRGDSTPLWGTTTANTEYHVDQTYNSPDADGSASRPYNSIEKVFSEIPRIIAHTVTVYIHGTYNNSTSIYTNNDGETAMIGIRPRLFCKRGALIISGSTSVAGDTVINCFSVPSDFTSPGLTDHGICIDKPFCGDIYIKNMRIIGYSKNGIKIDSGSRVIIDNVILDEPGATSDTIDSETDSDSESHAAISIHTADTIIQNSTITGSNGHGIYVTYTSDCGLHNNTITGSAGSGVYISDSNIHTSGNTISTSAYNGIYAAHSAVFMDTDNCSNNTTNGVKAFGNSNIKIEDATFASNNIGIYICMNSTANINAGTTGVNTTNGIYAGTGATVLRGATYPTGGVSDINAVASEFAQVVVSA